MTAGQQEQLFGGQSKMPWMRGVKPRARGPKPRGLGRVRQAAIEALETRCLLSVDTVTTLADSGAGSLRATIASAASGDTIQFNPAIWGNTITLSTGSIAINENLTITGPGSASLTVSGGGASSVFSIGAGANVSISGLTITAGNGGSRANGGDIFNSGTLSLTGDVVSNGAAEIGAGLFNNGGVVTISSSTFTNNKAIQTGGGIINTNGGTVSATASTFSSNNTTQESGGGVCNEVGSMTLTNCTVNSNSSGMDGGGIANFSGGTLILNNTSVSSNFSSRWGAGILNFANANLTISNGSTIGNNISLSYFGGGIFNYEATLNISNSTLNNNFCTFIGAGIMDFLGSVTVTGTTFSGNGSSSVVAGGAIYMISDTVTLNSCILNGNQAGYGAGIYVDTDGVLTLSDSTIQGSVAQNDGGAIYDSGQAYISNTTIANNTANGHGGGVVGDGLLFLVNDTIALNISNAVSGGGGVYINSGDTTAYNTIIATNTAKNATNVQVPNDVVNNFDQGIAAGKALSSNNLIGTGGSGGLVNGVNGNQVGAFPNLGPLQYNGGPTGLNTMALLSGSSAINAGSNALAKDSNGVALTTDERGTGFPRIVSTTVDIGAYEVQGSSAASQPAGVVATPDLFGPTLSKPPALSAGQMMPDFVGLAPAVSPASSPYVPAEVRGAYGVNNIFFNGVTGDGRGQTVAIVDAFNDPNITADAATFSTDFNLPQFNMPGGPTFQVLNQTGGATLPSNSSAGQWDIEESLDVEWAHAFAPMANIILFEANSASNTDLFTAVATAAATAGVSVVSMSFGEPQLSFFYSGTPETTFNSTFKTPAGHQGVTFLASTGDSGALGVNYPALSANVVSVGGTSLLLGTDNSYLGESAWSGGGGGLSFIESQPGYQSGNVNGITTQDRATPDVSMIADPQTGVLVIDTFAGGTFTVGGTSVATPMWGALIAIVNQGRAQRGQATLDGVSQTLPMLYALPSTDFHDVTTGDNGFAATNGYDLATGRGTPIANLLVPALAGFNGTAVWTGVVSNDWYNGNNWNTFIVPNSTTNVIINFGTPTAASAFNIGTLAINGGTLSLGTGSGGSVVTGLTITGNGTLNLANNHLFINYGAAANPISTIAGYIASGFDNGLWNGVGIISSTALANPNYSIGYASSADAGNPAGLAPNQDEIAFTLAGDVNLDGAVNGVDFGIVSSNFNHAVTGWDKGDFNYDGVVNGVDFGMLAANFNKGASLAAADTIATAISNPPVVLTSGDSNPPIKSVLDPTTTIGSKAGKATVIKVVSHRPVSPPPPPLLKRRR
jgi:hypothetical protein